MNGAAWRLVVPAVLVFLAAVSTGAACRACFPHDRDRGPDGVPPAALVRLLSLDHPSLAADLYLARLMVYTGSRQRPEEPPFDGAYAYGLIDLITGLDPRCYEAYRLAGMGLIHEAGDVERARPVIERGMRQFPDQWELPFWLGYWYYTLKDDPQAASRYLFIAANRPGAPREFLVMLQSAFRDAGNWRGAAWALAGMMETASPAERPWYARRLARLRNLTRLQEAADAFRVANHRDPGDISELIGPRMPAIPEDPFGARYVWDRERGRPGVVE